MIFVFTLFPIPTGVTIFILAMISILAVELASPVSPPIPVFLGDDTPCETHREQEAKQNRRSPIHPAPLSGHLLLGLRIALTTATSDPLLFAQAPRIPRILS
jgi:hypothetical protein